MFSEDQKKKKKKKRIRVDDDDDAEEEKAEEEGEESHVQKVVPDWKKVLTRFFPSEGRRETTEAL